METTSTKGRLSPGPWGVHGDGREIRPLSDSDGLIVIADVDPDNTMPEQREANAFLLAAAPDLLAALEGLVLHESSINGPARAYMHAARAAIARATGKERT